MKRFRDYLVGLMAIWLVGAALAIQAATITVAWDQSATPGIMSYRVYGTPDTNQVIALPASGQTRVLAIVGGSILSAQFTVTNATWRYFATALDGVGVESLPSNVVTNSVAIPPAAPTNFRVTAMSASRIDLNWKNSVLAEAVTVRRQKGSSGPFVTIATLAGSPTSYIDGYGLKPHTTYGYQVADALGGVLGYWSAEDFDKTFRH